MVVGQVLVQLVRRQEPQLALGALAHALTIPLLLALTLGGVAAAQQADPLRPQQWYLDKVHAEDAWRLARGEGVVVAVVDTGVDASHPDLAGKVLRGLDIVDEGTPPDDPNGHGTLVAGLVGAIQGNGVGVAGSAPAVRILPVRVLDEKGNGDSDMVARGVRWAADNGAHVINLSLAEVPGLLNGLGGLFGSELLDAIRYADERGAVVVAAAGNEGSSSTPYPSDLPLLVVGATDQRDQVWTDSNRDARTVFAPGVGIVSTWKDHGYGQANGTSFATPLVSGIAAILRDRGLTAGEIRGRIETSTTSIGSGRGRVDFARAVGVEPSATTRPTAAPPGPGPGTSPVPSEAPASPGPDQTAPPGASNGWLADPSRPEIVTGVDAPSTVVPLPDGAGDPVEPSQEPDGESGLEIVQPRAGSDALPWVGLVALLGVVGLFVRAARRP